MLLHKGLVRLICCYYVCLKMGYFSCDYSPPSCNSDRYSMRHPGLLSSVFWVVAPSPLINSLSNQHTTQPQMWLPNSPWQMEPSIKPSVVRQGHRRASILQQADKRCLSAYERGHSVGLLCRYICHAVLSSICLKLSALVQQRGRGSD